MYYRRNEAALASLGHAVAKELNRTGTVQEIEMEPSLHVSLNVSDAARSRDFYAAFFGVEPAKVKPGYVKFVTSRPALHLALNETGKPPLPRAPSRISGLRVGSTAEVDEWKDRVTSRGVASFDEKDTTCCYARQDKFWVTDPDGNRWEVYTVLEDVETAAALPTACCDATCCASGGSDLLESRHALPSVGLPLPDRASRNQAPPLPRDGADRLGEPQQLPFAWRILTQGVCDGCALGTTGLRDWTIDGVAPLHGAPRAAAPEHDARARSRAARRRRRARGALLARSCAPSAGCPTRWSGAGASRASASSPGTRRSTLAAGQLRAADPERIAFYLTSRGIPNETYYAAQKAARFLGTNHVDNSARLCHAASTVGDEGDARLRRLDLHLPGLARHADLIVFFGSNVAQQPAGDDEVPLRGQAAGRAIAVVNPYREPGLERYWVPSVPESALFGTRSPTTGSRWTPAATSPS